MTASAKPIMFARELKLVHFIAPAFSYAQFANCFSRVLFADQVNL